MSYSTKAIVLAAGFALAFPLNLWGEEICGVKLCEEGAKTGLCFRSVSENPTTRSRDPLLFMRTNPVGSLACFKEQAERASNEAIVNLSRFSGYIGGDVKPDNVDMVRDAKGNLQIGLIDLDDGGWGSLFVDVLHTLAYSQIWGKPDDPNGRVPLTDALAAYQAGLKGEELKGNVPTLNKILEASGKKDGEAKKGTGKKVGEPKEPDSCEKVPSDWESYKLLTNGEGQPPVPKSVSNLYEKDSAGFDKKAAEIGEVRKRGYDRKEYNGGSMCAVRFGYLVCVEGKKLGIVQFKHQPDWPGAAALVFGGNSSSCVERIESLIKDYRPLTGKDMVERDRGDLIHVGPGASGECYIVRYDGRPKMFKEKKVDSLAAAAYTKRMLHWLGRVHAKQNPAYVSAFKEVADNPAAVSELKEMVGKHIEYLTKLASDSVTKPAFRCD